MKLKLIYLYPDELNLYGDRGNIEILANRAVKRNINVELVSIGLADKVLGNTLAGNSILFMGGGPDSGQKIMYGNLLTEKALYIKDYIESGGVSLFICGSYQLMGKYYKSADGDIIDGISALDLYTTQNPNSTKRCVGNIVCKLSERILADPVFSNVNRIGNTLVGFENHGGKTYLSKNSLYFGKVLYGYGNNGDDKTEGVFYKNTIGTYLHGPILSKNSHIADFLVAKALKVDSLDPIDDAIIKKAHSALVSRYK